LLKVKSEYQERIEKIRGEKNDRIKSLMDGIEISEIKEEFDFFFIIRYTIKCNK